MRAGENVGWVTMAFVLMSGQIGHGVLCVPSAYREMGYVGATLAILLLSAATTYTGLLLARIRKDRPDIASYQQLFTLAFSSPAVGQCAACCVNLFLFAAICSSVLVQAEAWSGIFPAGCSLRWIAVAAASSTLLLQVRTLSGIGVLSIANCAMLVGLNGVLLGSLFSRASSGSKQAGPRVPFPAEGVAAWVSLLDLLFSFAGHAVFFELMQEMATPDDFSKSVWLSQGLTTFAYLFTGIFAHAVAGDANWMTSPATLSLDDGPGRDACHALIVICFPTALLVDGTVLVSRVRAHFQPLISAAFGRVAAATGSAAEEGARAGAPVFRSDPEKLRTMEGDTDDGFAAERAGARTHWSWSIQLWWLLWCGLTMLAATVVATATAAFSKLVGVIAALAACQTSVTWPGALFYQLHERSRRRQEECYYHGNGTSPCRCSRRNGILSLRLVVALLGLVLGVGGVWGNSIDMASRWRGEKPLRLFACDGSSHVKAAAAVGGPLLEYMP